jgi:hypothetical protein
MRGAPIAAIDTLLEILPVDLLGSAVPAAGRKIPGKQLVIIHPCPYQVKGK